MAEDVRGEQTEALVTLAAALDAVGVDYYVTGSVAAGLYGMARMSADVDVVIDVPRFRAALVQVLAEDFEADAETIAEALREGRMFNLLARGSMAKLDMIPRNRTLDPDEVIRRRQRVTIGEDQVYVISPEDLIIAKLNWSKESKSEMQVRDVRWLLGRDDLDVRYVEQRAAALGLRGWLDEVRA